MSKLSIEQMLLEAAGNGDLLALTLWPRKDGWQANVKRRIRGQEGWACEARVNPVDALHAALTTATTVDVIRDLPRIPVASAAAPEPDGGIFG